MSFWLILKQQSTIKISSPFFLFLAWWLSWLEIGITGHHFGRGPSKDHSTKVWFKLAQWLQRSWLKCENLTDGRTTDDGRSGVTIAHLTLPFGSGELKTWKHFIEQNEQEKHYLKTGTNSGALNKSAISVSLVVPIVVLLMFKIRR